MICCLQERQTAALMIILAPPGSGKTYFVQQQADPPTWIDQDVDLAARGWDLRQGCYDRDRLLEADRLLAQERLQGRHILGSLFWEFVPDAVVLLPLPVHEQYVALRPDLTWEQVLRVRQCVEDHVVQYQIPRFSSLAEAIAFGQLGAT